MNCPKAAYFGYAHWGKIPHFIQKSHFENINFRKIHIFQSSFFTEFTCSKSHFSQNSHFQNLSFDKIHIYETPFSHNSHFSNMKFQGIFGKKVGFSSSVESQLMRILHVNSVTFIILIRYNFPLPNQTLRIHTEQQYQRGLIRLVYFLVSIIMHALERASQW